MKFGSLILLIICIPNLVFAAGSYPIDGVWAALIPSTDAQADCTAVRKLGLRQLSGNAVGEVVVFSGSKRLDFGGYADTESKNLSVEPMPDGRFKIVDQYYDDGEGGGRAGPKRKSYMLRVLNPTMLELTEAGHAVRYTKCASQEPA
jgi:hypothetical protein